MNGLSIRADGAPCGRVLALPAAIWNFEMDLQLKDRVAVILQAQSPLLDPVSAAFKAEGAHVEQIAGGHIADELASVARRHGRCDIAISLLPDFPAASPASPGWDEDLRSAWDHVGTTAELFRACLPTMLQASWGRCLFIGRAEAKRITTRAGALERCVSLGILGVQKALSGEVGGGGVTCNSVLWEPADDPSEQAERIESAAAAATYLASPVSDFVTGVVITVDKGAPGGVF